MWLGLAPVALAGIDVNGTVYATLADAVGAAQDGDTLVFDGATYDGGVQVNGITLTFVGNGSTLQVTSGTEVVRLTGGASLTASDLTFSSTVARGIDGSAGSSLDLIDVRFATQVATGNGGAIQLISPNAVELTRVLFDHTSVGGTVANGQGGALFVSGAYTPVVLTDVTFDGVSATNRGGAIYASASELSCAGCAFTGTSTIGEGGAIYSTGVLALTITDSTFTTTSAGSGGAIRTDGPLTVSGTTFCNTAAGSNGGAILSTAGGGTITSTVFVDAASTGSGIGSVARLQTGTWSLVNNHVLSAFGSTEAVSLSNATVTATNNLFAYNEGTALVRSGGGWAAGSPGFQAFFGNDGTLTGGPTDADDVLADPRLAGFSDDGICGNDDLWPGFGSPLIDAGDPAIVDPDGGRSDIGAFGGPGAPAVLFDDGDNDGAGFLHDCDDLEAQVRPGLVDRCDGLDNDCSGWADDDPRVHPTWFADCDGDGQGTADYALIQCDAPSGPCAWVDDIRAFFDGMDCDDLRADVHTEAPEWCFDGYDTDCDGDGGDTEEGAEDAVEVYRDADGDGYGTQDSMVRSCVLEVGWSAIAGDCDDALTWVYPGAQDACGDEVDADCGGFDGEAETAWYIDDDGDGFGKADTEEWACEARPGQVANASDCDDGESSVHPEAREVCDGVDNDCNGRSDTADADLSTTLRGWEDADGDGFGGCSDAECAGEPVCEYGVQPDGRTVVDTAADCNDNDASVSPAAVEAPGNLVDEDCDGSAQPEPSSTSAEDKADPLEPEGCGCATGALPAPGIWAAALAMVVARRRLRADSGPVHERGTRRVMSAGGTR